MGARVVARVVPEPGYRLTRSRALKTVLHGKEVPEGTRIPRVERCSPSRWYWLTIILLCAKVWSHSARNNRSCTSLDNVPTLAPDFAIIDLHMPKLHGLEVIQKLREANSRSKLVVLTISHDEKMALWALRAGANGYLVEDGPLR